MCLLLSAVDKVSASQLVDLEFNPLVKSYEKTLKNDIYSFPACTWHFREVVENKLASLLVVSLGKALNGTSPPLCGRHVAQIPWKWQLPSESGRPIQNMANKKKCYSASNNAVVLWIVVLPLNMMVTGLGLLRQGT